MFYLSAALLAKSNDAIVAVYHGPIEKLDKIDIPHIINNLIPVTIGNIVGGGIIIAGIYCVIYSRKEEIKNTIAK